MQELQAKHLQELERISGLTSDQAKEQLLSAVKEDVKHETAMYVKENGDKSERRCPKESQGICGNCNSEVCSLIMWQRQRFRWYSFQTMR